MTSRARRRPQLSSRWPEPTWPREPASRQQSATAGEGTTAATRRPWRAPASLVPGMPPSDRGSARGDRRQPGPEAHGSTTERHGDRASSGEAGTEHSCSACSTTRRSWWRARLGLRLSEAVRTAVAASLDRPPMAGVAAERDRESKARETEGADGEVTTAFAARPRIQECVATHARSAMKMDRAAAMNRERRKRGKRLCTVADVPFLFFF